VSKFSPETHEWPFLRMRSENVAKIALNADKLVNLKPLTGNRGRRERSW